MLSSTPISSGTSSATHQLSHQVVPNQVQASVPVYFLKKAMWMRLFACVLLAGLSPVILLTMLLVRMTSSGPALFRQQRLGKEGKLFEVIKIRTMYCDAEDLSGPILCQPGDSRITPIGRLLRFLHLDELPQLVNVVRGEMCLVGPRPERPEIIARHKLNEKVTGFADRTKILPGVTGLAQINLPADQTADCVIPKVKLDLEYLETANASLDLRILLCTALRMLGVRHGRAVKLFGVGRTTSPVLEVAPRRTGPMWPKKFRLHLPRPTAVHIPTFAHSSAKRNNGSSHSLASKLDEFGVEVTNEVAEEPADFAALPNRPR